MNLNIYRESEAEQSRTADLIRMLQYVGRGGEALDIGARDGHFSLLLTEFYERVTALDLDKPSIKSPKINCLQGDITNLNIKDGTYDLVFCAEVLEHIPSHLLHQACSELTRVSKEFLVIGVPYMQDIRVGRTTCNSCGEINPPWGHVNSFDRKGLISLFPQFTIEKVSFVGDSTERTNFLSRYFMDKARNPYGTYGQEEPCIYCDSKLMNSPQRNILQLVYTKIAFFLKKIQSPFNRSHPNWIHMVLKKVRTH